MSSTVLRMARTRLPFVTLTALTTVAMAQVPAGRPMVQPIPPGASAAMPEGSPDWQAHSPQAPTGIHGTIAQWRALQQSDTLSFATYAGFLLAHPGWPGEDRMRRLAEAAIQPDTLAPVMVDRFFAAYPPRTATGFARHALALSALGRTAQATTAAKAAWRGGTLAPADEAQLLSLFGTSLYPEDHAVRADVLLWQRRAGDAERLLPSLPAAIRPVIEARIAMQRGAPDAIDKMVMAQPYAEGDPGFLIDANAALRDAGQVVRARAMLAQRHSLTRRPFSAEKWFETLLSAARGAVSDGNSQLAYDIASKVDDAYDPQVEVRDRPIGERDDYTSLVWLAGTTAYYQLGQARAAVGMFERYATAARSPQTMAKGYYWAARAALMAGDTGLAQRHFTAAGAYPDQFHGQLALERLGRPIPAPADTASALPPLTDDARAAFASRSLVQAAKALGAMGQWADQSLFLRTISAGVSTDTDRALAYDFARALGRADLGVMVGRKALSDGRSGYVQPGFPTLSVPMGHEDNWTIIHAITRQESQFDRAAVSRAGARGLMQLMPGTARETAGKIGLAYTPGSLTGDPQYNIALGSTYIRQMLRYYGGSYPLAIAAYNAGPGNVNRWLAANGDPRLPGGDIIGWIENIPLSETRNYVQRVLENAVVYDAMRPDTARFRGSMRPLSDYLGKPDAG